MVSDMLLQGNAWRAALAWPAVVAAPPLCFVLWGLWTSCSWTFSRPAPAALRPAANSPALLLQLVVSQPLVYGARQASQSAGAPRAVSGASLPCAARSGGRNGEPSAPWWQGAGASLSKPPPPPPGLVPLRRQHTNPLGASRCAHAQAAGQQWGGNAVRRMLGPDTGRNPPAEHRQGPCPVAMALPPQLRRGRTCLTSAPARLPRYMSACQLPDALDRPFISKPAVWVFGCYSPHRTQLTAGWQARRALLVYLWLKSIECHALRGNCRF